MAGLECAPFVVAHASSAEQSVFDSGLPTGRTEWIRAGTLTALLRLRFSAELTGLALTPFVDSLGLTVDGAGGSVDVADVERGTAAHQPVVHPRGRPPDPAAHRAHPRWRLPGRGGEVVGATNNFQFNESPVALLDRFAAAGATVPALSREWGDCFPRTAMPPLRVPDFNMSTVSEAL